MARLLVALFLLFLQAPAGRVSMNVRVVKAGTTEPVGRAVMVLARVGGQLSDYQTGTADTLGIFQFRNLTPGSYRIYAEHEGYLMR
jgi:hypothetical protein